ncbi:hypothetical protein AG1IA_07416 [Rhizoctonia solani AG-1 IA]|uniref:Uncharacterized protein n=1 Tax=Thanatephorus cucumeris (strain AG1-IA) TaxID=983506 RepID=L8WP70_THACA|nr:hypothetical protein AG1IA_07416 [Rhizoctonia solani AG-1 IA]
MDVPDIRCSNAVIIHHRERYPTEYMTKEAHRKEFSARAREESHIVSLSVSTLTALAMGSQLTARPKIKNSADLWEGHSRSGIRPDLNSAYGATAQKSEPISKILYEYQWDDWDRGVGRTIQPQRRSIW